MHAFFSSTVSQLSTTVPMVNRLGLDLLAGWVWRMNTNGMVWSAAKENQKIVAWLVAGLNLTYSSLDGMLPSDLVLLSASLTVVDLSNNNLPGTTPSEIGELTLLNGLFLSKNHVADSILPTTISGLTKLLHMNLSLNSPSSLIPSEIGNMLSLQWLRLGSNALKGKVPTEMGTLGAELTHLDMATNNLFYELPSEIGKLIRLKEMLVQDNKLAAGGAATT